MKVTHSCDVQEVAMGDIMRPIPFSELINRIFSELRSQDSIFGIDRKQFFKDKEREKINVFGKTCTTPCGPAAGPHTQLAQNIITSYLVGGRFIELKTVQIMDELVIAKPCIDCRDEGYNVEWSTEYTLEKAYDEYLKAWIIVHLIQALMRNGRIEEDGFIFNMSVGYNLEGIKQPKMQKFINSMMDSSIDPLMEQYLKEMDAILSEGDLFEDTPYEGMEKKLEGLSDSIDSHICSQVTISTMHGCPPKEIEAICRYMLTEKKLNTFVKLNPTLLGYDSVREILDNSGFGYVGLKRESFEKDLQFSDAMAMLHRLRDVAAETGLGFGVKLTNTLGSINDQGQLPGDEMYMSGRALMPISTRVAALLSREFEGNLPISYSGGANAFTIQDIFDTGIRPITMATDMLKPGGYSRMTAMIDILQDKSHAWKMDKIDVEKIEHLADVAGTMEYQQKAFRGTDKARDDKALELFDCFSAPCIEACPIHQDIPDYIALTGDGRYAEALELIYQDNALPNITCNICDHQCQFHCSRMDYEGAVKIRDMKKTAVEKGSEEFYSKFEPLDPPADVKAAVVGAGPAGLSAAFFLARAGFQVTVFEREEDAGGVVRHVIPEFRIAEEAIEADIKYIARHGVNFKFGAKLEEETVSALKSAGFDYVFYAVGSESENELKLDNQAGADAVIGALEFLGEYRNDCKSVSLGTNVVVCGGGNTAMDSARAALRVPGVEHVTVVYRRTENEMPADREEYELAMSEGIAFCFLSNPVQLKDKTLTCAVMELGEPDASGRRRPVETDKTFEIPCDNLIPAIGEKADEKVMNQFGIPLSDKKCPKVDPLTNETEIEHVFVIGDAQSGPSTVVRCIASARKAVEAAIDQVIDGYDDDEDDECSCQCHDHEHDEDCSCGCHDHEEDEEENLSEEENQKLIDAEEEFMTDIHEKKASHRCSMDFHDPEFESNEAKRCLDCPYYCCKCVEVCPNRANVAIDVRGCDAFEDPFQIVHLDAYCNECGNCAEFCNHEGKPYRNKFTLFSRKDDFESSTNSGFFFEFDRILVRMGGKIIECEINGDGEITGDVDEQAKALIEIIFEDYNYLLGAVEE